ncbi:MAG: transglycosylase domain-containing protein [bacterium]
MMVKKTYKKILIAGLVTTILTFTALAVTYYILIIALAGSAMEKENIKKVFQSESPVYYDDEKTVMGVFFDNAHRDYIESESIPRNFKNAIIAIEDKNFYKHHGIDWGGILRAVIVNIKARRVVQGGSTITQQTAKNIFHRKGRTIRAKLWELILALRLEAYYSKDEILEFFSNQFYVCGTGRGLGIAAKYFFSKSHKDLTLGECAFIAGSLRGPNLYNPLLYKDPEKVEKVKRRGIIRRDYILKKMYALNMITKEQFEEAVNTPLKFVEGEIYYKQSVAMELIRQRLQSDFFQNIFSRHGINNFATSGIRIYSSMNASCQKLAVKELQNNLSTLDVRLQGYAHEDMEDMFKDPSQQYNELEEGKLYKGIIREIIDQGTSSHMIVDFGEISGIIDYEGMLNIAHAFTQHRRGKWVIMKLSDYKYFLNLFKKGDMVLTRVRKEASEDMPAYLDLLQYPRLQGGLIALKNGQIITMVGGFENIYYNRATYARRQLGSIFKPILFCAAMQLGWNNLDPLQNTKDIFTFEGQFYFPKPDHLSPHNEVSLAWAGVKSENLASIWLLYHLCDHLSFDEFKQVAEFVGMAPLKNENYEDYKIKVRDKWGVVVCKDTIEEAAFNKAKDELLIDLAFESNKDERESLGKLHYGRGFERYIQSEGLRQNQTRFSKLDVEKNEELKILSHNFLRYEKLADLLEEDLGNMASSSVIFPGFYFSKKDNQIIYSPDVPVTKLGYEKMTSSYDLLQGEKMWEDIFIEDTLKVSTIRRLRAIMEKAEKHLRKYNLYDLNTLFYIKDFKTLVGLRYLVKLSQELGIESYLAPVLSYPLGPNAISILEAAKVYSALTSGYRYIYNDSGEPNQAAIIKRIEDSEGSVIYELAMKRERVIDPKISSLLNEILKNVVQYGTGKSARETITLDVKDPHNKGEVITFTIPTLGKTGTANKYSNSSYIGILPFAAQSGQDLDPEDGFVIGCYVGYDDNRSMSSPTFNIAGASGALPVWIKMAQAIVEEYKYAAIIDESDLIFRTNPIIALKSYKGSVFVGISPDNGLRPGPHEIMSFGELTEDIFIPTRFFIPLTGEKDEKEIL